MSNIKVTKVLRFEKDIEHTFDVNKSDIDAAISESLFILSDKRFEIMNKLERKRFLCDLLNLPYQTPDKQLFRELYNETIN